MNFFRRKIKDTYLENTSVENMFLIDYMPFAEEDFVKVYLTGLMSAGDKDASNSRIARHLNLEEERVLQAWNHWEKCGVIRKHYPDPSDRFHYDVEFLSLKEQLYSADQGDAEREQEQRPPEMKDEDLRALYAKIENITGRMLDGREPERILSWIEDDGLPPDFIAFVYRFCADRRGKTHFYYVSSVLKDWAAQGIRSVASAEKHLEETEQNLQYRKRVMQALGFRRNPTEAEEDKIDSWFEELGFSMDRVLEACARTSGISNPNINYVDKVLRAWSGAGDGRPRDGNPAASGGVSAVQLVQRSYDETRKRHREEMESRVREVYQKIPEIRELDEQIRRANIEISRAAFSKGHFSGADTEALRKTMQQLRSKKDQLLKQSGYPEDYMEMHYDCPICEDSGVTRDGGRCRCYAEKLRAVSGAS